MKYEILLQILFFGLALFFKFLILTCFFKKISASLRNTSMSCNFCYTSFQSTWDEGVIRRPSVVVNFSHLQTAKRNLPKLDRKQLQYYRTLPPIRVSSWLNRDEGDQHSISWTCIQLKEQQCQKFFYTIDVSKMAFVFVTSFWSSGE